MRSMRVVGVVMAGCLALARTARADDRVEDAPASERVVRHVIDGNVAVALAGRYGLTYQFLPAAHHALVVAAWRQTPGLASFLNGGLLGVGGEVGWRLYSDARRPTGLWIGATALAGYHTANDVPWFATYGGALEGGAAFIVGRQLHLAFGGGVQLAHADVDDGRLTEVARLLVGGGLSPRVTVAIGHVP